MKYKFMFQCIAAFLAFVIVLESATAAFAAISEEACSDNAQEPYIVSELIILIPKQAIIIFSQDTITQQSADSFMRTSILILSIVF